MSVRQMAAVWQLPLPSHLKLVLLAVADHANDEGWAYPGQASLGAKCSTSERQVRANLAELEELGYLEKHRRGNMRTNLYRVMAAPAAGDRQPTAAPDRQPTAGVTGDPPPPNHQGTTRGTISSLAYRWVDEWAQLRQVPLARPLRRTWGRQVQEFIDSGGEPSMDLLRRAHSRGIEQPAGWGFAVAGTAPAWPGWMPAYLLDAVTHPDRKVDARWEREYSYGPGAPVPADRQPIISAKHRLQALARDGTKVDEQLVLQVLVEATTV